MQKHGGIRVIIVDDEELARRAIRALLARHADIEVMAEAANGHDAIDIIGRIEADIVFLDIQMPGLGGFEVLQEMNLDSAPLIIFVTAFDEHAIQAFERNALDYLLKPIDPQRFERAIERAFTRLRERADGRIGRDLARLLATRPDATGETVGRNDRITFRDGARLIVLDQDEVEWIGAEDDYIRVHTARKTYLVRETLSSAEQRLDHSCFARIHRSTLVNVNEVREMVHATNHDAVIVMRSGERLRASRSYREVIADRLKA